MMTTEIEKTKEKTKSILDGLSDLLSHGWLYCFCDKSLAEAYSINRITRSYFFMGCRYACHYETILTLCKLFIKKKKNDSSITIYYLLDHAKANPKTFPNATEKEVILAVKKHDENLSKFDQLKLDIKFHRDKSLAHFDRDYINNPSEILAKPGYDMNEVEECYREIHRTINTFYGFSTGEDFGLLIIEKNVPDDLDYILRAIEKAESAL